jgi:hypothetical protein
MHRSVLRRLLLPLCFLAIACARHAPEQNGGTPEARGDVLLVIENHHWNDVIVSLLHDGVADRLGLATAVTTTTFTIPRRQLGMGGVVQLRAHAVGAPDSHTTETITVQPGQQIQWTLESDLSRSSDAVH